MKTISLSQGKVALLDDADFSLVSKHKWHAVRAHRTFYAQTNIKCPNGGRYVVSLHRFLMGLAQGDELQVDHINGDGLDNRRSNLRVCTKQQNLANMRPYTKSATGLKGVTFNKPYGKYQAQIRSNGKKINLGYFTSPVEAAHCYDKAAQELRGEYARTNF